MENCELYLTQSIRDNHRVCNMAVHVVCGVNLEGKREVLAVEPMYEESEASYTALFTGLKKRGLKNVWLAVSDAHQGLVSAIKKSFVGCSWQRCKVHFMRNILVHVPAKDKESSPSNPPNATRISVCKIPRLDELSVLG
jgi:putative transposase